MIVAFEGHKMIVAFTGHRPDKLGGYIIPNPTYDYVMEQLTIKLMDLEPDCCISGMALGFDQYAAKLCIQLGIPVIAAIPFKEQPIKWNKDNRRHYNELLDCCRDIVIVTKGGYANWKFQERNKWMVDNSDQLVSCWNGTKGGTKHCRDYAIKVEKVVTNINPLLYK